MRTVSSSLNIAQVYHSSTSQGPGDNIIEALSKKTQISYSPGTGYSWPPSEDDSKFCYVGADLETPLKYLAYMCFGRNLFGEWKDFFGLYRS